MTVTSLLAARVRRLEGEKVTGRVVEVDPALSGMLPGAGLQPGSTYTITGSTALAAALIAKPTIDGLWCGVVGMPGFAAEGAAGLGADLRHVVFVPHPGPDWVSIVAVLVDALTIVVVKPPAAISDGEAARLAARLRQREAVLIACGEDRHDEWPKPDLRIAVAESRWIGLGAGHGHLEARQVDVISAGRGAAVRPRRTTLWLPDADGRVRVADTGIGSGTGIDTEAGPVGQGRPIAGQVSA